MGQTYTLLLLCGVLKMSGPKQYSEYMNDSLNMSFRMEDGLHLA